MFTALRCVIASLAAHLQADIVDTVSFVTSYNHVIDVMASRYDMTT